MLSQVIHSSYFLLSLLLIVAGLGHFVQPAFFMQVMPPWMPFPDALLKFSGVLEITLGFCLLYEPLRVFTAWCTMLLFIVYFFVNHLWHSIHCYQTGNGLLAASLLRLALQPFLILWAARFTQER